MGDATGVPQAAGAITIRTLSTRPDLVSGGDVLVEVRAADSARLNRVAVTLNGRAVTGAFQFDSGRQALVGLLEPVDPKDYTVTFTPAQLRELHQIFPEGVCDYSKPGLGQQLPAGTFLKLPLRRQR